MLFNVSACKNGHTFLLLIFYFSVEHLQGENGKMSASDPNSAIYVTDSAKEIKNKVGLSNVLLRTFSNKINLLKKDIFTHLMHLICQCFYQLKDIHFVHNPVLIDLLFLCCPFLLG